TIMPCSPDTMRRETLSLMRSSGSCANVLKPTNFGMVPSPALPGPARDAARRLSKLDFSATGKGAVASPAAGGNAAGGLERSDHVSKLCKHPHADEVDQCENLAFESKAHRDERRQRDGRDQKGCQEVTGIHELDGQQCEQTKAEPWNRGGGHAKEPCLQRPLPSRSVNPDDRQQHRQRKPRYC